MSHPAGRKAAGANGSICDFDARRPSWQKTSAPNPTMVVTNQLDHKLSDACRIEPCSCARSCANSIFDDRSPPEQPQTVKIVERPISVFSSFCWSPVSARFPLMLCSNIHPPAAINCWSASTCELMVASRIASVAMGLWFPAAAKKRSRAPRESQHLADLIHAAECGAPIVSACAVAATPASARF